MIPFNGGKIQPRLMVRARNKTFSWLFDTSAAMTCMNKQSFEMAFSDKHPRKISDAQSTVATSGNAMGSYGIY